MNATPPSPPVTSARRARGEATSRGDATRFAWLSIAAAVVTIAMKTGAWWLTGSVGLLSDALESLVNLAAAVMTLAMLSIAHRPPDDEHAFGYGKAEYFASGAEGAFILLAAVGIAWAGVDRLLAPRAIEQPGFGLALSTGASLVNLGVSRVLLRAARRHHSIALEADAHHLMTDVWTSAGVLAGIGLVAVTGWERLDPVIALLVATNILWTGARILRRSAVGLLDVALAPAERDALQGVLDRHGVPPVQFHALRTRQAGARRFVAVHVLVPGHWTVSRGHALLERIEEDIRSVVPNATVLTHLEALEDPTSWEDIGLDRDPSSAARGPPAG
jgi:cation diffusion facilitator family transporter